MIKHLENRQDIEHLVNSFYDKIRKNEKLGYIFEDIAQVNWEKHLPKMYSFWEMILFEKDEYKGAPLRPHLAINAMHTLDFEHFNTWLVLFEQTVHENFNGEKAEEIILRAKNIAKAWAYKIDYLNKLDS